jgi:hypothetical protein
MTSSRTPTRAVATSTTTSRSVAPLHGPWLLVARVAWIVLTLLVLALNIVLLPRYQMLLQTPCSPGIHCFYLRPTAYDQQFLRQFGLSLGFLATYQSALNMAVVAIYCAIATVIFWQRSSDRMALLCAFVLVLFGGAGYTPILQDSLATAPAASYGLMAVLYILGQTGFVTFFLLFPNGRFVPSWSWLLVLVNLAYWTYQALLSNLIYEQNFDGGTLLFFALILSPVAAQIYRYRRVSTHKERQQTKWVVFGFVLAIVGFVTFITVANLILSEAVLQSIALGTFVQQTLGAGFLLLIPIAITIAMLRSQLYDIDVIINRTLVYGSLSAILALIYVAGVVGVQAIVNVFTQRQIRDPSPILIVVTTLVIAALFQPLRHRLQRVIDRRFYRRKYNVEQTLASFSLSLRQEVNLGELRNQLLKVVQQTMEPTSLSLWLRSNSSRPDHS